MRGAATSHRRKALPSWSRAGDALHIDLDQRIGAWRVLGSFFALLLAERATGDR
jgi:hypothetical protein